MNPNWLFLIVPVSVLFGVFAAYYMNTYEGFSEGQPRDVQEEALLWLARAYRGSLSDRRKYTRWNMAVAYAAGKSKGLSEPNPARPDNI